MPKKQVPTFVSEDAHKRDVPYQSLIKLLLAEAVERTDRREARIP